MPYVLRQAQDLGDVDRIMFDAVYKGIVKSMQLEETISTQLLDETTIDFAAEKIGLEINDPAIKEELEIYLQNTVEYLRTTPEEVTPEEVTPVSEEVTSPDEMGRATAQQWLAMLSAEKPEGMEDYVWERNLKSYRALMASDAVDFRNKGRGNSEAMGRYIAYMDYLKENAPEEHAAIKEYLAQYDPKKKDPTKFMGHPGTDPYRNGTAHASGDKPKADNYEGIVRSFRKRLQEGWGSEIMGNDADRMQYLNGYLYQLTGNDDTPYTTGYGLAFNDLIQEFGLWNGNPPDPGDDMFIPDSESASGGHIAQQLLGKSSNAADVLKDYMKQSGKQSPEFMDGYWDAVVAHSKQFSIVNPLEDPDRVAQATAELASGYIPPSIRQQFEDSLGVALSPEATVSEDTVTGDWVIQDVQNEQEYSWAVREEDTPEGTVLDIHTTATDVAGYISNYYKANPELHISMETAKPYSYKQGGDFTYQDYQDMGQDISDYYDQLAEAHSWSPEEQAYNEASYIYQNTRDWKDLDSLRILINELSPDAQKALVNYVPSAGSAAMDRVLDWFFMGTLGAPGTERVPELEGPHMPTTEQETVTEFEDTTDEDGTPSSGERSNEELAQSNITRLLDMGEFLTAREIEWLISLRDALTQPDVYLDEDTARELMEIIVRAEGQGYTADLNPDTQLTTPDPDTPERPQGTEQTQDQEEATSTPSSAPQSATENNLLRLRTFLQEYEYPSEYRDIVDMALEALDQDLMLEGTLSTDELEFLVELMGYADQAQETVADEVDLTTIHRQQIQELLDSGVFKIQKNTYVFKEWLQQLESGEPLSNEQHIELFQARQWMEEQQQSTVTPEMNLENLRATYESGVVSDPDSRKYFEYAIEALEQGTPIESYLTPGGIENIEYYLEQWKKYEDETRGASKLPATEAKFWKEATEPTPNPYDGGGSWRSRGDATSNQFYNRGPGEVDLPILPFQIGDEGTLAELNLPIVSGYLEGIAKDKYGISNFLTIVNEQDPKLIKFIMSKTKPHAVWEDDNLLLVNLYRVHDIADLMGVLVHDFTHVMSVLAGRPMSDKEDRPDATVEEYIEFPEEQDAYIEYIQFRSFILREPRELIKEKLLSIIGPDQEAKVDEWLYLALGDPIVTASVSDPLAEFYPELLDVLLLTTTPKAFKEIQARAQLKAPRY